MKTFVLLALFVCLAIFGDPTVAVVAPLAFLVGMLSGGKFWDIRRKSTSDRIVELAIFIKRDLTDGYLSTKVKAQRLEDDLKKLRAEVSDGYFAIGAQLNRLRK